jgi:hypothetical protein
MCLVVTNRDRARSDRGDDLVFQILTRTTTSRHWSCQLCARNNLAHLDSSSVAASGVSDLTRSVAALAASSESRTIIDRPVLPFRVQRPVTNPGVWDSRGTARPRTASRSASESLVVSVATVAYMTVVVAAGSCRSTYLIAIPPQEC